MNPAESAWRLAGSHVNRAGAVPRFSTCRHLKMWVISLALLGTLTASSATVTWDGGGGNLSWQTAANWSGDALPGLNDEVVIDVAGNVTITSSANVTILSLHCSNNLALSAGTFRVRAGASVVQGQLTTTGNPTLSATGAVTSFTVFGPVSADGASFEALNATLSLPGLGTYSKGPGCGVLTWSASGGLGVLDFPGLTVVTGAVCAGLTIQALNGGQVRLPNLTATGEGTTTMLADGTGSLVDLPAAQQSFGTTRPVTFEARNSGAISMPQFAGGANVIVTLKTGGTMPVAQLRQLRGFTVTGMAVTFPALTNITSGHVTVDGGGTVTLPGLTGHDANVGCYVLTWGASGAGSVLDLSQLVSLNGPDCGALEFAATAGGTVILSRLPVVTEGTLAFSADGANSLVDLSGLTAAPGPARIVAFDVRNAGTILAPLLPGGPTVTVALQSAGALPVAQLRQLRGFTVNGMDVNFPALTNLTVGNITVTGGAVVTAPSLTRHDESTGCPQNTWLTTGAGSRLDVSSLTNLTGATCGYLNVQVTAGGACLLDSLTTMGNGTVSFLADGTNSLINLSTLTNLLATTRAVSFEARNSGTIAAPLFRGGPTVTVAVKSGGSMDTAQMRLLKGLTVSETTLVLPELTNLFAGDLIVSTGGVLRLPGLTRYTQVGCPVSTWLASGPGSVLDLSGLTHLAGPNCGSLTLQALSAGTILASNLLEIAGGALNFVGDGANSVIDLAALRESSGTARDVSFEVRNAGTVWMPQMSGGPTVGVTIKTNGVMPVAQLTRLAAVNVTGSAVDFPGLTHFDGGSFSVSNAASVTAPNLVAYARGGSCTPDPWIVSGAHSVLNLPGLGSLTGGTCLSLDANALGGGQLLVGNLGRISLGTVYFLASGSGSLIDLHSLSNFLNPADLSRLTATNGGTILLPAPSFLSGVTVNFAAGTPGGLQSDLGGTNLVMRGNVWHSYWVEQRDATSPANPWTFLMRVPLTNEFQIIAPRAAANREFQAWEFVAEPFGLELAVEDQRERLVLYAPSGRTFEVLSTTNLTSVIRWEMFQTVTMTNTFRILPPAPVPAPERYFRTIPR